MKIADKIYNQVAELESEDYEPDTIEVGWITYHRLKRMTVHTPTVDLPKDVALRHGEFQIIKTKKPFGLKVV